MIVQNEMSNNKEEYKYPRDKWDPWDPTLIRLFKKNYYLFQYTNQKIS
jgi:hypothetical protein